MKTHSIALTLPIKGNINGALRSVSAAMMGGVGGLALALAVGLNPAVPILTGLVLGLALGSPTRPKGLESFFSTTVLATGGVFWAGALLAKGATLFGWPIAAAALGLVAGARGKTRKRVALRFSLCTMALALVMVLFQAFTDVRLPLTGAAQLIDLLFFSAAVGGAAWLGSGVDVRLLTDEHDGDEQKEHPTLFPVAKEPRPVTEDLFGEEEQQLEKAKARIEDLSDKLVTLSPMETGFVDQLRGTLNMTMERAQAAIERWRMIKVSSKETQAEVLRERIAASRERLENIGDNEPLRHMLEETITRQSQTLEEIERLDSERYTFGLRLEQVLSGLELLELTVERVLTAGGAIDSTEVDAIVEAMADVHAVLEAEAA